MAIPKLQNITVTEKDHWESHHPDAGYKKRARLLDG